MKNNADNPAQPENAQNRERRTWLYNLTAPVSWWLVYPFFRLKIIKGKNNIPSSGGAIAAGNHISFADPICLYYAQKRQLRYMAKAELFKNPFLRFICRSYGAFPVDRGSADSSALETALQIIKDGKVLAIFPEGTRSKDGTIGRGKSGIALLAYQSQAPIYPFAVYAKRKPFRHYTVAFGEPVTAKDLGIVEGTAKEFRDGTRRLMEIIRQLHDECREARE